MTATAARSKLESALLRFRVMAFVTGFVLLGGTIALNERLGRIVADIGVLQKLMARSARSEPVLKLNGMAAGSGTE